jgi:hypothetical protein
MLVGEGIFVQGMMGDRVGDGWAEALKSVGETRRHRETDKREGEGVWHVSVGAP